MRRAGWGHGRCVMSLGVLTYPQFAARVAFYGRTADVVLETCDTQVQCVSVAARVPAACKGADDQEFLDLAPAHRAVLLSKDQGRSRPAQTPAVPRAHVGSAPVMATVVNRVVA